MKENIKQTITERFEKLKNSQKSMKDIFEIMFSTDEWIISEKTDGYRIITYTYAFVRQQVYVVAKSLSEFAEKNNIKKGGYVGLAMDNKTEWIISFWAILMCGFKPFLINTRLTDSLIKKLLDDIQVVFVLSDVDKSFGLLCADYNKLTEKSQETLAMNCDNWADEIALSTTATTLNPKICFFSGKEMSAQILSAEEILKRKSRIAKHYKGRLKLLAFLPFYHIFGLCAVFMWFCFFGRTVVFLKDLAPDTILRTCRKHEVTHIFGVPMFWNSVSDGLKKEIASRDEKTQKTFEKGLKLSKSLQSKFSDAGEVIVKKLFKEVRQKLFGNAVKFCISGGSYLRQDTLELLNAIGYPLYDGFGMSEVGITSVELGNYKQRLKNSVGKPLKSVKYKIQNKNGVSTLQISGEMLCKKYMQDGIIYENSSEYFDTKDIVKADDDGRYYVLGRSGDLVIGDSGENVNPDLVEQHITLNLAKNFCVLGLGVMGEEKLCLVVEPFQYTTKESFKKLYDQINSNLSNLPSAYRIEKIYFATAPIMSATAIKVSRKALRKNIENGNIILKEYSQLDINSVEEKSEEIVSKYVEDVILLFAKTLKIPKDGITQDSNFSLDLGGTSLDYYSLINEVESEYSIRLNFNNGDCPYTPRDLAKTISEAKSI